MALHHLLCLTFFLLLLCLMSFSIADDATIMTNLLTSMSNPPPTWQTNVSFCKWEGILCDNSSSVTSINLSSYALYGTLPSDLNSLSNLETLDLHNNSFSGALPTLANLTRLQKVYLDTNSFTSIPKDFFLGLTSLQHFSISGNYNLGRWILPNDLTQCTNLSSFVASYVSITGSIPVDFFTSLPNLQDLNLSYNSLGGNLPSHLKNLSRLRTLDLQGNSLSGRLPTLGNLTLLEKVYLNDNTFTSIPQDFFYGLVNLKEFSISNNLDLAPWILPYELNQITELESFEATNASIHGPIPDIFNTTRKLLNLYLADNSLTGILPDSLTSLPNLTNINLQNNMFMGKLPMFRKNVEMELYNNSFCLPTGEICDPQVTALLEVAGALGYPMSLVESWKGNDACRGWKFVSCDSLKKKVVDVNFVNQRFSGTISPFFASLTSLRSLTLNGNNLTGTIPERLTSLKYLRLLDVSNNNLSGRIPKFSREVKFLYDNNRLLDDKDSRRTFSLGWVIGSVISGVLVLAGIVLLVFYKCYRVPRKSQIKISGGHGEIPISDNGNIMISIQLLEQATDSFNDNNVVGRGGFGTVYKGELHDGTKIAVKKMKSDVKGTKGPNKEFNAEIGVLTKVRHRHLVALLGYCINDNERLLVYEYMSRGTLSQHLFKWREHNTQPLSWKQRVSIGLDVGRGVEYMHSLANQIFIHRDLKPANILLDDGMRAKVADFGLVKNAPDGKYSIETRLAGTFGYLAPEYAATGRVTTKVDVFAFGVILMQLITGRKALDGSMPDERYQLVTWFRRLSVCKENMVKFRDQVLDTDDGETLESILKVAELARHCTASEPFQRPNMGYVVGVLAHLVEEWNPSRNKKDKTYVHEHHMSLPKMLQDDMDVSRVLTIDKANSF